MTVTQMTDNPVMKVVGKFVFMDIHDYRHVRQKVASSLKAIRKIRQKRSQFRWPINERNTNKQRFQAIPCLSLNKIKDRMKRVIQDDPLLFKGKMRPTPRDVQWYTSKHEKEIETLEVFPTQTMNILLRQVLKLQSSKKAIRWVAINLIKIMWTKPDYHKLVASSCLANYYFEKAFRWAIRPSTTVCSSKDIIKDALNFLRKDLAD